ncbi:hypothetical protein CVT25_003754 [Psilocybe cyanescens]|uniref:AB hydrolase-1 domain-containing protein n=1 Tax=Psilocybe cyanescens TaxID=93625 RepID=A0A409XTL2_PSICY|nr:hypothetical protein CVT25_003754 [Psilocybe cyanescens]
MSWNATKEGTIPFSVDGKTYATWYRVFGDIKNRTVPPLVVLHGGPGLSHDYLLPISDISSSRPVIFYDQLGNAKSTHIHDKEKAFWTIDLFIDELINVLRNFHIEDEFDLLGHSWGGILGFEFELRRKPAGLRRLVVTNSLASMPMWDQSNAQLVKSFPAWVQEGMAIGLKDLKASAPAMKEFRTKHGCKVDPFPREYVDSLDHLFSNKGDPTVTIAMFSTGLKAWDIIDKLPEVGVPILLINGRFDVSQDWVNAPIFAGLRKVKWATFENSSHTPFWEEREKYMKLLDQFLSL